MPRSAPRARRRVLVAIATAGLATALLGQTPLATATTARAAGPATPGCHLGNGISHVVSIVFDNVHFARDNPNVPSDLEQMPHLLRFLEDNGTVMSNTHTPMIAHTADDSLSIYTGLYGDRHGQPLSNSYRSYNADGSTDSDGSFAYWTDPAYDTASTPGPGHDTSPSMAYSATVPARQNTGLQTPAPWVPFTRAGCDVGNFSTANMVLENTALDLSHVFGPGSPEVAQYNADPDPFKDPETTDYVGVAVHCARRSSVCTDARATKYGQSAPSPTAVPDVLPTEPGGYHGFDALFGARYVAPQLGAGTPSLSRHGFPVTDSSGNLTDLAGNTILNQYSHTPGFPGFDPTATQSLAYLADMQESGIPVTYGYISDLHERKPGTSGCTTATSTSPGNPLGPGDSCYVDNARAYDRAFETFFRRLSADGITPANTLFVISAEENDQLAGANVGRASRPTPAGCDGVTVPCHYAAGQIGELQANIKALLSGTASAGTSYEIEPQGASIYAHGQPGASDPALRQLERDTAGMTGNNPYSGAQGQHIVKYQAGDVEQRILHMRTADPKRFPSYTMFPVPDYYFSTSGPPQSINDGFGWNHGYYSPNIDVTWSSMVGPGVRSAGVDGPTPSQGNEASDPNSERTVPEASTRGTWVEEVDLRPTMLWLTGLRDDYRTDGRVISQVLAHPSRGLVASQPLASAYQQINSSVGALATTTLQASTRATGSGSAGHDGVYARTHAALLRLAGRRDALATRMKQALATIADGGRVPPGTQRSLVARAHALLRKAEHLDS
ncbi:MAG: hypothetical protein ACRDPH_01205 [Marmoricola sp.]